MKKDRVVLLCELDLDESVLDFDVLDSAGEGIVTYAAGEGGEEVLALQLTEPGIRDRDAVDGEVIEDDRGVELIGFDQEASAGIDGLATENGDVFIKSGAETGMERAFCEFDLKVFTEGGVGIDEAIDLALGEDDGVDAGLVLSFFDALLDVLLFSSGEDDWGILLIYIPDRSSGGEADGEKDHGGDEDGAPKIALREDRSFRHG